MKHLSETLIDSLNVILCSCIHNFFFMTEHKSRCTHNVIFFIHPSVGYLHVHYAVVDSTVINTGMQVLCVNFNSLGKLSRRDVAGPRGKSRFRFSQKTPRFSRVKINMSYYLCPPSM